MRFYIKHRNLTTTGYFVTYSNKRIDKRYVYDIMVLTLYPTGERYERSKIRSTSKTKISKPSARESHQRALPNKRLLRSPGPSPGQVRDASACTGRQAADPPGRFPVWFLTAIGLQGSGCFRSFWATGTDSDQTRPSPSTQAERVCGEIHRRTKERGWIRHFRRTDRANPKAVRVGCAHTKYSTGYEAHEKKTALTRTCPEEFGCPGATDPLCRLYEQLRSFVLESSDLPGQVYGLGVMLRQGMRAWIEATVAYARVKQDPGHVVSQKTSWIVSSVEEELCRMLAAIVLNRSQKEVA
jgi:hypothetical protein